MPGFSINGTGDGPSNTTETSRKHRFLVKIFSPLAADILFFIHRFTPPSPEFDSITMHHKQEEIYLPGKSRISGLELQIYRAHNNNFDYVASQIYDWHSKYTLEAPLSNLIAVNGSLPKRNGQVDVYDAAGNTVWRYYLYGLWPQKTTPDTFDFKDSSVSSITIALRADKVEEQSPSQKTSKTAGDICGSGAPSITGATTTTTTATASQPTLMGSQGLGDTTLTTK